MAENVLNIEQLIAAYSASPELNMWFLGAGASRTAHMPTASDLIWELKLRQYCREENQDIQLHDIANRAVRTRIQAYFVSKGAPSAFSPAEYSFYFEQSFRGDYSAQQRFLLEQLSPDKISLNVGQRVLAAMMAMGVAKVVFTTNFDAVLEAAMAAVAGKNLSAFHLEGSYGALDALNAGSFPLYAKLHGDFRYRSVKNLSEDLRSNDAQIERAFLAATNRFGMIVTGYSGRDENVMRMFHAALEQANPFPNGLFWTVTGQSEVTTQAKTLIAAAKAKGVRASIVEAGTFDMLMTKLWRQLPNKTNELAQKVRPAHAAQVSIPLPKVAQGYPVLRTNALVLTSIPDRCGRLVCTPEITYERLRAAQGEVIPEAVIALENGVLFWGAASEVEAFIPLEEISSREAFQFENPLQSIRDSTILKAFFEHGLAKALCEANPVVLRRRGRTYHAVASNRPDDGNRLESLMRAVGGGARVAIFGAVPGIDARWAESVSIRLEERNGTAYLLLEPGIWITPNSKREFAADFIRARRLKRYNGQSNGILDAWIAILLKSATSREDLTITGFASEDYPVTFTVNSRTAYSGRGSLNVS